MQEGSCSVVIHDLQVGFLWNTCDQDQNYVKYSRGEFRSTYIQSTSHALLMTETFKQPMLQTSNSNATLWLTFLFQFLYVFYTTEIFPFPFPKTSQLPAQLYTPSYCGPKAEGHYPCIIMPARHSQNIYRVGRGVVGMVGVHWEKPGSSAFICYYDLGGCDFLHISCSIWGFWLGEWCSGI